MSTRSLLLLCSTNTEPFLWGSNLLYYTDSSTHMLAKGTTFTNIRCLVNKMHRPTAFYSSYELVWTYKTHSETPINFYIRILYTTVCCAYDNRSKVQYILPTHYYDNNRIHKRLCMCIVYVSQVVRAPCFRIILSIKGSKSNFWQYELWTRKYYFQRSN